MFMSLKKFNINFGVIFLVSFIGFQRALSEERRLIPSFEKIVKEQKTLISVGSPFYGCIEKIKYSEKDAFTGKNKLEFVWIKGAEQNGIYQPATLSVDLFDGISEDNPDAPKIGQCYAFEPILNGVYKVGGGFAGVVKLFKGTYEIDNSISTPELKNKLTVTDFFEDRIDYGSKIIEITGNVFETDYNNLWFKIRLFSEKFQGIDDKVNGYYSSKKWKDDKKIKQKLISIKDGELITLKGYFGGPNTLHYYNGFEILEIVE